MMLKYMIASAVVAFGLSQGVVATEGTMQPPAQAPVNVENPDTHEGKPAHKHHHKKKHKKHKKNHKNHNGKNHEMKKEDKKEEGKKEEKPAEEKK